MITFDQEHVGHRHLFGGIKAAEMKRQGWKHTFFDPGLQNIVYFRRIVRGDGNVRGWKMLVPASRPAVRGSMSFRQLDELLAGGLIQEVKDVDTPQW